MKIKLGFFMLKWMVSFVLSYSNEKIDSLRGKYENYQGVQKIEIGNQLTRYLISVSIDSAYSNSIKIIDYINSLDLNDPEVGKALFFQGVILKKMDSFPSAIQMFEKAIETAKRTAIRRGCEISERETELLEQISKNELSDKGCLDV